MGASVVSPPADWKASQPESASSSSSGRRDSDTLAMASLNDAEMAGTFSSVAKLSLVAGGYPGLQIAIPILHKSHCDVEMRYTQDYVRGPPFSTFRRDSAEMSLIQAGIGASTLRRGVSRYSAINDQFTLLLVMSMSPGSSINPDRGQKSVQPQKSEDEFVLRP
ncbi:uncharacterized protein BDZ83DRAFT_736085 [Colletotrichum acutatum]|uniref:Uncharacterized protein n=1 Tax=Glomerella acutata TaxID=27357 RepID=A0AAD8UA49_GLOAC|nr:uncharacterized protein BDZ83DRAFT_736085 [Colletotrichum acutatum]KAK1706292.1 hypothetical protein BDZ83DRAFT_736085 [Colletotrichum acutatum]